MGTLKQWLRVDNEEKANEVAYLTESVKYKCYHAYDALLIVNMKNFSEESAPHRILQPAMLAALYHWTPGYCLLYDAYRFLGNQTNDHLYYLKAFEAMLMAKKLQPHTEAQQAVHAAYFGKGLIEGNNRQFKNWDDALNSIITKGKLAFQEMRSSYSCTSSAASEYYQANHHANDLLADTPTINSTS